MVISLDEKNAGQTIKLNVSDSIQIKLEGNPTTGYIWMLNDIPKDGNIVVLVPENKEGKYVSGSSRLLGAGGTFVFDFNAVASGKTKVSLEYKRSWEKVKAIKTFEITVEVASAPLNPVKDAVNNIKNDTKTIASNFSDGLKSLASNLKKAANDTADNLKKTTNDTVDNAKTTANHAAEHVKQASNNVKNTAIDAKDAIANVPNEIAADFKSITNDGKGKATDSQNAVTEDVKEKQEKIQQETITRPIGRRDRRLRGNVANRQEEQAREQKPTATYIMTKKDVKDAKMKVGETIMIQLDGNPTTGYTWSCPDKDSMTGALKYENDKYVYGGLPGMVGAGGTYYFVFKAAGKGNAKIHLEYKRSWEKNNPPASVYDLNVVVE